MSKLFCLAYSTSKDISLCSPWARHFLVHAEEQQVSAFELRVNERYKTRPFQWLICLRWKYGWASEKPLAKGGWREKRGFWEDLLWFRVTDSTPHAPVIYANFLPAESRGLGPEIWDSVFRLNFALWKATWPLIWLSCPCLYLRLILKIWVFLLYHKLYLSLNCE